MSAGTLSERLVALAGSDECSRGDLVSAHVDGFTYEGRVFRVHPDGTLVVDRAGFMRAGTTRYVRVPASAAHLMRVRRPSCCEPAR
jgi:hypothetical protein